MKLSREEFKTALKAAFDAQKDDQYVRHGEGSSCLDGDFDMGQVADYVMGEEDRKPDSEPEQKG